MAFTPTELVTKARERYNANDDNFWSNSSLYQLIYEAQMVLAREALCIQRIHETTTVASTREYAKPTNTISIKRVEYDGIRVRPYSWREDDAYTFDDSTTTVEGSPEYYTEWNESIFLRPTPDDAKTLKIYSYMQPQIVTQTSTLEVPDEFHSDILLYMLAEMASKEQNYNAANRYYDQWLMAVREAKKWYRRKKRGDDFAVVFNEDVYSQNPRVRG